MYVCMFVCLSIYNTSSRFVFAFAIGISYRRQLLKKDLALKYYRNNNTGRSYGVLPFHRSVGKRINSAKKWCKFHHVPNTFLVFEVPNKNIETPLPRIGERKRVKIISRKRSAWNWRGDSELHWSLISHINMALIIDVTSLRSTNVRLQLKE